MKIFSFLLSFFIFLHAEIYDGNFKTLTSRENSSENPKYMNFTLCILSLTFFEIIDIFV